MPDAGETIRFETDHDLHAAIRDAIADETDADPADVTVPLYDDIDPDALDDLLRQDARPETAVELHTNAVKVTLWGDGSIEIDVLDPGADT